ncbi:MULTISPECIES: hypothetical protein [Komagataeibacter]|uniref:Uncharacterized protein n=3 Tax=Komagataeibacter TaxID=1434011 RepID=A0A0D6QDF1_KOMXY|nr:MULTISPECIES: hypothetical protein [Komagataeibacter]KPH88269.1 hypothetical protein GLUCOINTEAF2_0201684 [Komagataeibacter intermedius AF2]MBL7232316.1 hypothetical protein [Komagataeibacter oboediens]MBV0887367.1 hypothetical protein [Komagataeibacter oboediens]MBV1824288.1 hypothetical protein [Komagataeibacter oboediens]MCF3635609.1 hypothetical protein [Komagataeibacter intermedius]
MRSFSPVPAVGFSPSSNPLPIRTLRQRVVGWVGAAYRKQGMMLLATLPSIAVPSGCHAGMEGSPSLLALRGWDRS